MERNKLKALNELLEDLMDERGMDDNDLEAVKRLKQFVEYKTMVDDCKQLMGFMDRCLHQSTASEEELQNFYNMNFIIQFGHKAVVIPNNADVFNNVYRLLKEEVEEYDQY